MEEGEDRLWGDVYRCITFGVTDGSGNSIPIMELNCAYHLELRVCNQWESREVNFRFLGLEKLSSHAQQKETT